MEGPDSPFVVGMATLGSICRLILHGGDNGVCFDSSWRSMNENRAPVTFLVTIDDEGHMQPGAHGLL